MQVSKTAKVFNIADEFLVHVFKAHLIASICTELKLESKSSPIQHDVTLQWLEHTAESLLPNTLMPATSKPYLPLAQSLSSHGVLIHGPEKCHTI